MFKIEAVKNLGGERLLLTHEKDEAGLAEFLGHLKDSGDWAGYIEQTAQRRVRLVPVKGCTLIITAV